MAEHTTACSDVKQQLCYFDELIKVYEQKCPAWRIVEELKRTVKELAQISPTE
jgi:hypothetical protein